MIRVKKGVNDLATLYPALVKEWCTDKNGSLRPEDISYGSTKKIWWTCSICGNEWMASANHRSRGRGCPICAKRRTAEKLMKKNLVAGVTDLCTLFPNIAAQWDYAKNDGHMPSEYSPSSDHVAYWLCEKGHSYSMRIATRTNQHQGCPYCAGKRVLPGFNDFKSLYPVLAKEWDYSLNRKAPEDYTAHSSQSVFWLCKQSHSYSAKICERTRSDGRATGCPYCAGKKALPGYNDLSTVRPELAAEWDYEQNAPLRPTDVTEFSNQKVHWVCRNGHRWEASVSSRSAGNGCPVCANMQLLKGANDLLTEFPEVAAEWDYEKNETRPEDHVSGTHLPVWWRCPRCGNGWKATIKDRAYGKTGCPRCTFYYKTSFKEQTIYYYIRKSFPDALNAYRPDFLSPREIDIYIPSLRLGIEYDGRRWHNNAAKDLEKSQLLRDKGISLIRVREKGLPTLETADRVVIYDPRKESLITIHTMIAEVFQHVQVFSPGVTPDIDLQRDYAAIKAAYEGTKHEKSLLYENPAILKEWNYERNGDLTPDMVTPHSHALVWWRCSACGNEWQQQINVRMRGGLRCEACTKQAENRRRQLERIRAGKTKALSDYPLLVSEWDFERNAPLDPSTLTYGSDKKVAWVCSACGNHFSMAIKSRTMQGQGCPLCGRKKSARTRSKKGKVSE